MSGFGTYDPTKQANKGNNRPKRFYLNLGSNTYRVLPPVGALASKNKIAQYWSVIWLTDTRNKKRPVASIQRKQNGEITQEDPILNRLEEMKNELNNAVAANQPPAVINMLKENLKRIMHKKFYAVNVLSASGELGVLELPYTSYQNFENRLKELHNQGVDAIGIGADKGVFFDFKRLKDERGKTVYPVDVAMKTSKGADGNFSMTFVRMPLTDEDAANFAARAEDLTTLYKEYSVDEMNGLATLDQGVFDAIFAKPTPMNQEEDSVVEEDTQDQLAQYQAQQQMNPYVAPKPQPVVPQNYAQQTTQAQSGYSKGTAVNSAKVKSFLFPDKKG